MKKLFVALSLLSLSLSLVSCDALDALKLGCRADLAAAQGVQNHEIRLYSNAYDGYVNIRQAPTTKSPILGRLFNGNDYIVQLGVQGNWHLVQWQGTVGYAHKNMVGYSPWKPVNIYVEASWLEGAYGYCGCKTNHWSYIVFSDGRFVEVGDYGYPGDDYAYGTWVLEGSSIVLTTKYVTAFGKGVQGVKVGKQVRFAVKINGQDTTIGDYEKYRLRDYTDLPEIQTYKNRAKQFVAR
ncbi:MAG: SH3 domain-containing protein [Alistipes sp.]|nr:SH3 domain-containing protein [Alistipes sp.]